MPNQKTLSSILLTNKPVLHNYETFHFLKDRHSPSLETVLYYGFTPVKCFRSSAIDRSAAKAVSSIDSIFGHPEDNEKYFNPEEKATLIKLYKNGHFNNLPSPIMLYQEKTYRTGKNKNIVRQRCGMDILGVPGSIAEAIAIQTSYAVLEEDGFKDLEVELNSVGDKPSREAFEKDLNLYIRSIINRLPEETKELCKRNPHSLFFSKEEGVDFFIEEAPKPISYLSEDSRSHLREVLEYLEELEIPYTINDRLLAHRAIHGHTIFKIISTDPENREENEIISAYGMRYSPLSRRLGYQKSTPAVGVLLSYKKKNRNKKITPEAMMPKFHFVHLGSMAKQKSLKTINFFRRERIPICHHLTKDRLSGQMSTVDKFKMPYIIIMGQKEAMEGTVMIRNTQDRSQETIPLDKLFPYLKKVALNSECGKRKRRRY